LSFGTNECEVVCGTCFIDEENPFY
jgi:hypothetical protein